MLTATEGTVEPGTEGFIQEIQRMVAYFYADNGLLVSTRGTQLQQAFDVLTEMFDWVGRSPALQLLPIHPCGIYSGPQGPTSPHEVLGPPEHGHKGCWILCGPF